MPLHKFYCQKCGKTFEKLVKKPEFECPEGHGKLEASLPESFSSMTMETKDKHRGVQLRKNQDRMMTKRMREHHNKYELEEKIDKYGMDEAVKQGWLRKVKKI